MDITEVAWPLGNTVHWCLAHMAFYCTEMVEKSNNGPLLGCLICGLENSDVAPILWLCSWVRRVWVKWLETFDMVY